MRNIIATLTLLALAAPAAAGEVVIGDGQIDGRKISPYSYTWSQCGATDGAWSDMGPLTESAAAIGDLVLRVRQENLRPDGVNVVSTAYLDRRSLAPLRMEQDVSGPDGKTMQSVTYTLNDGGHTMRVTQGDKSQEKSGKVSAKQLHGAMLGLPLATLRFEGAPFALDASIVGWDATYRVDITVAGKETIGWKGETVDLILVDAEWLHNENGDIYPPGPNASGGRFWIAQSPPEGFPYVARYKTDSYAVEFIPQTCKTDEAG